MFVNIGERTKCIENFIVNKTVYFKQMDSTFTSLPRT